MNFQLNMIMLLHKRFQPLCAAKRCNAMEALHWIIECFGVATGEPPLYANFFVCRQCGSSLLLNCNTAHANFFVFWWCES